MAINGRCNVDWQWGSRKIAGSSFFLSNPLSRYCDKDLSGNISMGQICFQNGVSITTFSWLKPKITNKQKHNTFDFSGETMHIYAPKKIQWRSTWGNKLLTPSHNGRVVVLQPPFWRLHGLEIWAKVGFIFDKQEGTRNPWFEPKRLPQKLLFVAFGEKMIQHDPTA